MTANCSSRSLSLFPVPAVPVPVGATAIESASAVVVPVLFCGSPYVLWTPTNLAVEIEYGKGRRRGGRGGAVDGHGCHVGERVRVRRRDGGRWGGMKQASMLVCMQ